MKVLLLSKEGSLHALLQQALLESESYARVWRTHVLATALPYLRQEPEIEMIVLDLALCGWSRLATLVNTLRPCLNGRALVLLTERAADAGTVRAIGVTVDACVPLDMGMAEVAERLQAVRTHWPIDTRPGEVPTPVGARACAAASTSTAATLPTMGPALPFTRMAW